MAVTPFFPGVVGIVVVTAAVPAGQHPLQFRGVGAAGDLAGPNGAMNVVGVNEDVQAFDTGFAQDLVGAAAQNGE